VKNLFSAEPRASTPLGGLRGRLFVLSMMTFVGIFVAVWVAVISADIGYTTGEAIDQAIHSPEIRAALWLSLWTSGVTVTLGLLFAVPMGYALSRFRFPGHAIVDSIVDLPIILPPMVVGLSLLVFFATGPGRWIEEAGLRFVFQPQGIVLCQLLVSASFGIRAAKLTFDGIDPRVEHVAMTLGCTRAGAFFRVSLPMARRGIIVAGILIWTRAFGIFGPVMIFVGTAPFKTEVLPTTIYLELSNGRIEAALAVAVLMLALASVALVGIRMIGLRESS